MKQVFKFLTMALGIYIPLISNGEPAPIGGTFFIKTDFWLYEIQGKSKYGKDKRYIMSSAMHKGIGYSKNKYIYTIPEGAQFRVVELITKNKRRWIYIVNILNDAALDLKEKPIIISQGAMLESYSRKRKRLELRRLDPSLFSDFSYPTED